MKRIFLMYLALLLSIQIAWSTHNRAGEITYQQLNDSTIECTIYTYSKSSSTHADRDSVVLCWGDGSCDRIVRVNGFDSDGNGVPDGEDIGNDFKLNIYTSVHSYSHLGQYVLSMSDPNRNENILNVNNGFSGQIPFYIETTFQLGTEIKSSVVFLQAPVDVGFLGSPFIHVPNAVHPKADSISYKLVAPLMDSGQVVPNYLFPDEILPGSNNNIDIDEKTGMVKWYNPQLEGEYNIAIEVAIYKDGLMYGRTIRDMQILIINDENRIPSIEVNDFNNNAEYGLAIGDSVLIEIDFEDSNMGQNVEVSSSSELYEGFVNTAEFRHEIISGNSGRASFKWVVNNEHQRTTPFQVVFKTKDDLGLANYFTVLFAVQNGTSGLKKSKQINSLLIHPNPCSEYFFIDGDLDELTSKTYTIFNSFGEALKTDLLRSNARIDIGFLVSGIYFFKIDGYPSIKFLKLK